MDKNYCTTSGISALEYVATAQVDRDMGMSVERWQQLQPSTRKSYAASYSRASSDSTNKMMTNLMEAQIEQCRKDRRNPNSQKREEDVQRNETKNQKKPQSYRPQMWNIKMFQASSTFVKRTTHAAPPSTLGMQPETNLNSTQTYAKVQKS